MFQMLADRDGSGTVTGATESTTVGGSDAQFNWFPINLYDTREGEPRDWASGSAPGGASTCSVNGVMNAVELDVANLRKWLKGTIGTTGTQVDSVSQNGYILYFSDRRGMLPDPVAVPSTITGSRTASRTSSTPPQELLARRMASWNRNTTVSGVSRSPEDVNNDGRLNNYGGDQRGQWFWHQHQHQSARSVHHPDRELLHYRSQEPRDRSPSRAEAGGRFAGKSSHQAGQHGRIHRGLGESGLHSGRLQQQRCGPDLVDADCG